MFSLNLGSPRPPLVKQYLEKDLKLFAKNIEKLLLNLRFLSVTFLIVCVVCITTCDIKLFPTTEKQSFLSGKFPFRLK